MSSTRQWLAGISIAALLLAACGDDNTASESGSDATTGDATEETAASGSAAQVTGANIQVMIASSGPGETAAVEAAVAGWETESGNTVELIAAEDINLQLGQALAGGEPPDVF